MEIRNDLKQRIKNTGHSLTDLIRESNGELPYQRVSGFLNGIWNINFKQESLMMNILSRWETEKQGRNDG